jgi:hypothetical protein
MDKVVPVLYYAKIKLKNSYFSFDMFTYTCERPSIIQIALKRLLGERIVYNVMHNPVSYEELDGQFGRCAIAEANQRS